MPINRLLAICLLLSFSSLIAASDQEQSAAFYESALEHFYAGDFVSAEIELKNAIQLTPDYLPARIQLGKTHLRAGNGAAAEKELLQARELGADENLLVIPLLDAYLLQGKYEDVVRQSRPEKYSPTLQSQVFERMGLAELELKNYSAAENHFNRSLQIQPDNIKALAGRAVLALQSGEIASAVEQAEQIVVDSPSAPEGWLVKAAISVNRGQLEDALRQYQHVLMLDPNHLTAAVRVAALQLDRQRYQEVLEFISGLDGKFAWDPNFPFFQYLAYSKLGQEAEAEAALQQAASLTAAITDAQMMANADIRYMVATIAALNGEHQKAVSHFEKLNVLSALDQVGQKLYARSLIAIGQESRAMQLLEPLINGDRIDWQALVITAEALERQGLYDSALKAFLRAYSGNNRPEVAQKIANIYLQQANFEQGIAFLSQQVVRYPDDITLQGTLSLLYLRNGDADKAMQVLEPLLAEHGNKPDVMNQYAGILVAQGKFEQAREQFSRLARQYPGFLEADFNLARLEEVSGNFAEAERIYNRILLAQPQHVMAGVLLARLENRRGDTAEALKRLQAMAVQQPDVAAITRELAETYMLVDDYDNAYAAGLKLITNHPNNANYHEILGRVYARSNRKSQAVKSLDQAVELASGNPDLLVKISRSLLALNERQAARQALQKALAADSNHFASQAMLLRLELAERQLAPARELAEALVRQSPDSALANELMGDVELLAGNTEQAIAAFQKARNRDSALAKLVSTLRQAGQGANIITMLEAVVAEAGSRSTRLLLAREYEDAGRYQPAVEQYRKILETNPRDLVALNNLSLTLLNINPEDALQPARQAYEMARDNPSVGDTYGWVLVKNGNLAEGTRILRDATLRQSRSAAIKYHLAYALAEQGRKEQAFRELQQAMQLDMSAQWQKDAEALMKKLQ